MQDRGVRSQPQKPTQERLDDIGSANPDRGHRPGISEHDRIREFIHELYEELLSLAVAARSILHWPLPPANEIAPQNPINRLDPNDRSRRTTEDQARETGLEKTLADSFPLSDPPSTVPDPPRPGVQRKALGASQLRPNHKRDVK
jgi:hypothetical protein